MRERQSPGGSNRRRENFHLNETTKRSIAVKYRTGFVLFFSVLFLFFVFFFLPLDLSHKHVIVKTITYNATSLSVYFFFFLGRTIQANRHRKLRYRLVLDA